MDIENTWRDALEDEFEKEYFKNLIKFVDNQYQETTVYPTKDNVFAAFNNCPLPNIKVVILGQDPYHEPSQANGLSFSVAGGVKIPPSLRNIFKELEHDLQIAPHTNGDLTKWAQQGVLLLNATLTVEAHKAGSHQNKGWEEFTDNVIQLINDYHENIVFILWGSYAQKKGALIDQDKHLVLKSAHPSPLSAYRGFWNNNHFSSTNQHLKDKGITPIQWSLSESSN